MESHAQTDDVVPSGTPSGEPDQASHAAETAASPTGDSVPVTLVEGAQDAGQSEPDLPVPAANTSGSSSDGTDPRIAKLAADLQALEELVVGANSPDPSKIREIVDSSVEALRAEFDQRLGTLQSQHKAAAVLLEATANEFDALIDRVRPGEVEALRQELATARAQLADRDRVIQESDWELRELRAAGAPELRSRLENREAALRSREEAVAARETMQVELDDLRIRNMALEAARARYEQHQSATERDAALRTRNAELERNLQNMEDRLEEIGYQLAAAKDQAKNQSVTLAAVRQSHERQTARARELDQSVHTLQSELAPLQKDLERMQRLEVDLRQESEERRRIQDELFEGLQEGLRQKEHEWRRKAEAELAATYAAERINLKERCERAEGNSAALAQRLEQAQADRKAALDREHALSLQRANIDEQVRTQTAIARGLQADVERLERRRGELDAHVARLEQEAHDRFAAERDKADRYRDDLQNRLAGLEGAVLARQQNAETWAKRVQDLRAWYDQERSERSQELARLDERIAEVRRLEHARLDASERIRSIEEPCFVGEALYSPGARSTSEAAWLEDVARGIEALGFVYPRRLLDAFHTSLKIAEWSPLTMLAGISGTGKSELPRLYAHLGGVHFLAMPVQPNWDSPQDLFGFFNYMDGRYKATDLLRALAQSQRPREAAGFDDAMLLVLLDEMNLARIELYFSELLSRLESRRGVSAASREAHMPIDVGSGSAPFQLPLRRNVLYVGTMNEDETTQAISDKVLDRGNVLTFPRPAHLRSRRLADLPDHTSALPFAVWSEWVREPADTLHGEVCDSMRSALERVNEGMERVQRAIGHRVLQSIEAYVANHPRTRRSADDVSGSDESWKLAFEDQLAQKIMPRLRGVDSQSDAGRAALGTVRGVLEQFAPRLIDDFDRASRADDSCFSWRSAHFLDTHNS